MCSIERDRNDRIFSKVSILLKETTSFNDIEYLVIGIGSSLFMTYECPEPI